MLLLGFQTDASIRGLQLNSCHSASANLTREAILGDFPGAARQTEKIGSYPSFTGFGIKLFQEIGWKRHVDRTVGSCPSEIIPITDLIATNSDCAFNRTIKEFACRDAPRRVSTDNLYQSH